jgi:5-methylcytosine-specific restriction endonuclease McrA
VSVVTGVSVYRRKVPIPCSRHGCPRYAQPGKSRCEQHEVEFEQRRRADPSLTGRRGTDPAWARARGLALHRFGRTCQRCFRKEARLHELGLKLEVHHVDGDATNHRQGNLLPLCETCHREGR